MKNNTFNKVFNIFELIKTKFLEKKNIKKISEKLW